MSGAGAAEAAGGAGGGVAHAAARQSAAAAPTRLPIEHNGVARAAEKEEFVGWVFLEIAVALAIAVLIVWWTLPRKPRTRDDEDER